MALPYARNSRPSAHPRFVYVIMALDNRGLSPTWSNELGLAHVSSGHAHACTGKGCSAGDAARRQRLSCDGRNSDEGHDPSLQRQRSQLLLSFGVHALQLRDGSELRVEPIKIRTYTLTKAVPNEALATCQLVHHSRIAHGEEVELSTCQGF